MAASHRVGAGEVDYQFCEQVGVIDAYACRLLPLTCIAPDVIEAILDGRQPKGLRLSEILGNGPLIWNAQRERLGFSN